MSPGKVHPYLKNPRPAQGTRLTVYGMSTWVSTFSEKEGAFRRRQTVEAAKATSRHIVSISRILPNNHLLWWVGNSQHPSTHYALQKR